MKACSSEGEPKFDPKLFDKWFPEPKAPCLSSVRKNHSGANGNGKVSSNQEDSTPGFSKTGSQILIRRGDAPRLNVVARRIWCTGYRGSRLKLHLDMSREMQGFSMLCKAETFSSGLQCIQEIAASPKVCGTETQQRSMADGSGSGAAERCADTTSVAQLRFSLDEFGAQWHKVLRAGPTADICRNRKADVAEA